MSDFLNKIDREIQDGLPHAKGRLSQAARQIKCYMGEFRDLPDDAFLSPWHLTDHRSDRHLLAMQKIIDSLTGNLYKSPPVRQVPGNPAATQFLEKVYTQNRMDALWRASDALAHASDEFAFQVLGTDDPNAPIRIHGWQANQFCVYTAPDDPLKVVAVVTLDAVEGRSRFRLWTDESLVTYMTSAPLAGTSEGMPHRVSVEPNPYKTIPFAFVHHNMPTVSWYAGGPGATLAEMNEHLNFRLSDLADAMRYSRPIGSIEGADATWVPPKWVRPGDWLHLPAGKVDSRGQTVVPSLNFTGPPLDFIAQEWADLQHYFDLTLQTVGVPPSAIRMEQVSAKSGVAIVAEQIPLILYAKNRQHLFTYYEHDLAEVVLRVAVAHLRNNNLVARELEAALKDFQLVVRFGDVFPDLPGPDRDKADEWLLNHGLTSKVEILMRRDGLSQEEAEERLEKLAKDAAYEASLKQQYGPEPEPQPQDQAGDDLQQDEQQDEQQPPDLNEQDGVIYAN